MRGFIDVIGLETMQHINQLLGKYLFCLGFGPITFPTIQGKKLFA
jgi:hypothetical protein